MTAAGKLSEKEIVRGLLMLRFSPDNRAGVRGGSKSLSSWLPKWRG